MYLKLILQNIFGKLDFCSYKKFRFENASFQEEAYVSRPSAIDNDHLKMFPYTTLRTLADELNVFLEQIEKSKKLD